MKTNIGRVMAIALAVLSCSAAAQSIVPTSGNGAVVAPGTATSPIVFEVRGAANNPIAGVTVAFQPDCTYRQRGDIQPYACVSNPAAAPIEVVSDSMGRVTSPPYTADLMTGNAWVMVSAFVESRFVHLPFYWTIGFSPRNPVQVVSGDNQVVQQGFASQPLVARVADDLSRPMTGVPVTFTSNCSSSVPCLLPPAGVTRLVSDAFGFVDSGARVANNVTGAYDVALAIAGVSYSQNFRITNVPPFRSATSRTKTGAEAYLRITEGPAACSITRMQPLDQNLVARAPHLLAVPEGLFEITIGNCPAGAKVSFSLQHPGGFPEGAKVWTARPAWQAIVSTNTIEGFWEFSLTDGAAGDSDTLANGTIQVVLAVGFGDPSAPNFQDLWWAGFEENGWGVSIVQHRDVLFVVVFAYDAAGQPTWYVMPGGSWNAARDTYTGAFYSPRGRPLNEHVAANLVMGAPAGTLSLTFSDTMNLRVAIGFGNTINPTIKFLERQLFGPRDARPVARMDDMWWAGASRNGWGLSIHQQYASLFNVLFTYGTDGKPVWFAMPAGTWTSSNVYEGTVYKPSGPMWPEPYDPALFNAAPVGAFKLDFANGMATFDFSAEGRSSRFPIMRMGF